MGRIIPYFFSIVFLSSCVIISRTDKIEQDTYNIKMKSGSNQVEKLLKNLIVVDMVDSLIISGTEQLVIPLNRPFNSILLSKDAFDIDILTLPFKIRPSVNSFPTQLNSNFNAALYVGKKYDFYHIKYHKEKRKIKYRGVGYGVFAGIGGVTMNPFVTGNNINYEYDGMVLHGGIATILDAKKMNFGIATGLDHLFDKNKTYWIYQNKPWIGILFGLNLN